MKNPRCTPVSLLISTLLVSAFLAGPPASGQATSSDLIVAGSVENEAGQPLADVEIIVGPGAVARAVSGTEGTFEIRLSPGEYQITASLAGYRPVSRSLTVRPGGETRVALTLPALGEVLAEIDVTASYAIDRREPVPTAALSGEEILDLPNFGNDLLRAVAAIPGVTANEASAQFNVRGGLVRDASIRLDGLEIFEPYHLKDFQGGIFSIVDPDVIGSLDLIPGGFPAEYGDKMAGVLNMTMAEPGVGFEGHLGASISSVWAAASGSFGAEDDRRYRFSLRRGFLDLLPTTADEEGESAAGSGPQYWDVIGRVDLPLSPSNSLSLNVLTSDDSFDASETEFDDLGFLESDSVDSGYGNSYLWLTHQALLDRRMFVDTVLSAGRVDRDRGATEESFGLSAVLRDLRTMDVFGLRQDWNAEFSGRHYLKWGVEARTFDVDYDYTNELVIDGVFGGQGLTRFVDSVSSENYAAYIADRFRLGRSLVAEVGVRYDRQTLLDDDQISPRLNLVYDLGAGGTLRAAWGQYYQSQRPNELQVEDGETEFLAVERADTFLVGWERNFGGVNLRLDAYLREVTDPRPYYINLFEATNPNPELTRDRFLVTPESSTAQGVELFLSRRGGARFNWWASYTWSEVTDLLDGRDVPRSNDQTHAVSLSGTYRFGPKWSLHALFNYHTGWPTTAVSGRTVTDPDGGIRIEPVLGPLHGERLDDYHRLDVRLSRFVRFGHGKSLEIFLDLQNLYSRRNIAGFIVDDRSFTLLPSGEVVYAPVVEEWLGLLPSFGIGFRF